MRLIIYPHSFTKFTVTSKPMVWYEYGTIYMGLLILYGLGMGLFIWSGYMYLYGLGMSLIIKYSSRWSHIWNY